MKRKKNICKCYNNTFSSKTLDVIVNCQVFELKQNTSTKMNIGTGQTFWGEHLFFLMKIENESFLFANRLKIQLCDYLKFGKGSLVQRINNFHL